MVSSKATTVEQYLSELPEDRQGDVARVRETILANLPDGLEETMQYGMIGYAIPLEQLSRTPTTVRRWARWPWRRRSGTSRSICMGSTPARSWPTGSWRRMRRRARS